MTKHELEQRIVELERERDEARVWAERTVAAVVEARIVTCVYCGHEYPTGTPATQNEALGAHIQECEKHPLAAMRSEREVLREKVKVLREAVRELAHGKHSGRDFANQVLADTGLLEDNRWPTSPSP